MRRSTALMLGVLPWVVLPSSDPAPAQAQSSHPGRPETIVRPGDLIRIEVWPDSALSGTFPVEETGFTYLPFLGRLQVEGRPIAEIRAELREQYGRFMSTPVVTVTPLFHVSVLGAVERPGLYQVTPTQTLFDVISLAGGLTETAKANEVRLIREGHVTRVEADAAMEEGAETLAVALQSGDRIIIPRRRRIDLRDVLTVLQLGILLVSLATN